MRGRSGSPSQATDATTTGGAWVPVSWDVAGTDANGVNACPRSGSACRSTAADAFTKVLAAATPNDGSEVVTVPRVGTVDGRVKVEAVGNVFYDAARGALAVDSGSPVLVNGPAAADLGTATVGGAGHDSTKITFSSDGPSAAGAGALSLGGADANAVGVISDGCSARTLAAYSECAVTVRLVPGRAGAQSATLSLASNDPASPATVSLTGNATAPAAPPAGGGGGGTPPITLPTVFDPAVVAAGAAGRAQRPSPSGRRATCACSRSSGRPGSASRRRRWCLAAAVCVGGSCSGKATAKLTLTPRKGRKRSYSFTIAPVVEARRPTASTRLTLKLKPELTASGSTPQRKATLTLTVTNGTRRVSRGFTLTT